MLKEKEKYVVINRLNLFHHLFYACAVYFIYTFMLRRLISPSYVLSFDQEKYKAKDLYIINAIISDNQG